MVYNWIFSFTSKLDILRKIHNGNIINHGIFIVFFVHYKTIISNVDMFSISMSKNVILAQSNKLPFNSEICK